MLDDGILVSSAFPSRGRLRQSDASPQLYVGDARSRIILAPSSGRGGRAKRVGVGILASENTASRSQPPHPSGHLLPKEGGRKVECVYKMRRSHHHFAFLIQAELSSPIKGQHAPRAHTISFDSSLWQQGSDRRRGPSFPEALHQW